MAVEPEAAQTRFESAAGTDTAEVAEVRHDFTEWLARVDVDDEIVSDLAVAFSELVTNAAEASNGSGKPIATRAWFDDADLVLEVANTVPTATPPEIHRWDLDDPLRPGGRGLMIVQAYTDDLQVDVSGRTLIVRCRRHLRS